MSKRKNSKAETPDDAAEAAQEQQTEQEKRIARLAPYRFKPGQSGNPGGRPKGRVSMISRVRKHMDTTLAREVPWCVKKAKELGLDLSGGVTVGDVVARALPYYAAKGQGQMMRELLDRIDGKVPDTTLVGGLDGGPLEMFVGMDEGQLRRIADGDEAEGAVVPTGCGPLGDSNSPHGPQPLDGDEIAEDAEE